MFKGRNSKRAQSAMEYLMTYGWAILIIAVVLGALFSLGVFSSSSFLGTTCIASSGFECLSPVLLHGAAGTSAFSATIGQSTGTPWTQANVIFVLSGQGPPTAEPAAGSCVVQLGTGGSFSSGQSTSVSFTGALVSGTTCDTFGTSPVPATTSVGSAMSGTLWATYLTTASTSLQYTQIATVTLKAS